jgi:hypothetical protein
MDRGMTFLDELQKMKREMDRVWDDLSEGDPREKEEKILGKDERSSGSHKEGRGLKQRHISTLRLSSEKRPS